MLDYSLEAVRHTNLTCPIVILTEFCRGTGHISRFILCDRHYLRCRDIEIFWNLMVVFGEFLPHVAASEQGRPKHGTDK